MQQAHAQNNTVTVDVSAAKQLVEYTVAEIRAVSESHAPLFRVTMAWGTSLCGDLRSS